MKTKKLHLLAYVYLMHMLFLHICIVAQPEGLLLWNTMDSQEDVVNSKVGPDILLTSYKVPHWTESRIEDGKFGNGLFINNGLGGSEWYNGANFFALDNQAMGLSPERGTIEFWFKFKYDCTVHNHAYIFIMENDLTEHYSSWPPLRPATRFFAGWSGWNTTPIRKFYFLYAHNDNDGVVVPVHTPEGSTYPEALGGTGDLAFNSLTLAHFSFVWDVDGIDESGETMRLYVDGEVKGSSTEKWATTGGILNYTYLGTTPNRDPYDHNYNGLLGVMDNLKVWDYAKTDYEDRYFEGFITGPEDITIECDASTDPSFTGEPEIVVNCEGDVTISYEDIISAGTCTNESTIERIWTITDACGNLATCTQIIKIVDTTPPTISEIPSEPLIIQNDPGVCGAIADFSFIEVTDNCSGSVTASFDPVDGTYLPVGFTTVSVNAEDGCGNIVNESFEVEVVNNPPEILNIIAPLDPVQVGTNVEVVSQFFDTNISTARWEWGDGEVSEGNIEQSVVSGIHIYSIPDVYSLKLILTDLCGMESSQEYNYVVIYNPEGGFVTGHGWIESPFGAYLENPSLVGKANFGFTSKYQKGAIVPTGNTKFKFKVADLNFESYMYDWLVVAGMKAKFKGEGMINDTGLYGFMISAIDGEKKDVSDKFRIKIWEKSTDRIVYDNQLNVDENIDPTTEIGAGAITVHDGNESSKISLERNHKLNGDLSESLSIYPNPANQFITIGFPEDYTVDKYLTLHLFNLTGVNLISSVQRSILNKSILLDIEAIPPGVYVLSIPGFNSRYKFVKN